MKKVFTLSFLMACVFVSTGIFAQCTPPTATGEPGLEPRWQELACAEQGVAYAQVINIENFSDFSGQPVDFLRIDSLTDFPTGFAYAITPSNTINSGETACMDLTGTSSDTCGNYKIGIYITVSVQGLGTLSGEASQLATQLNLDLDFDYYIRMIKAGSACPDTNFAPSGCASALSIETAFNSVEIAPNPVVDYTTVSVNSSVAATYTANVVNMIGKVVSTEAITVSEGRNELTIDATALEAGIYFYSLINEAGQNVSRKFIVSE